MNNQILDKIKEVYIKVETVDEYLADIKTVKIEGVEYK